MTTEPGGTTRPLLPSETAPDGGGSAAGGAEGGGRTGTGGAAWYGGEGARVAAATLGQAPSAPPDPVLAAPFGRRGPARPAVGPGGASEVGTDAQSSAASGGGTAGGRGADAGAAAARGGGAVIVRGSGLTSGPT